MARTHLIVDCSKPLGKQETYVPFTPEEEAEFDAKEQARRDAQPAKEEKLAALAAEMGYDSVKELAAALTEAAK